ncbi:hypothetical protein SLUN_33910 [Streptomyces lunaelactis]|uniref:Uncharacterized protein n=1 Tax=Streptomyces lunaelactis TaxID=1535768 RepID=A0A2R4TBG4_9ACTN|nr:hypothetical protein [Streptomyces lunaelactis]AVZ76466.1 hypothetical protein SLUN_33910 [Streptomyces lunaelactis]NUK39133.1 hypothetical protein [Streptomyces lunaelactis]NUK46282.1 hypothetical protein [Streptomyces lunaelactis]NUK86637.1 hypothetical protein [Streptomyces lunaelactis]NUK97053.1 hypothetical protein [Streptomyces lunaelactis]
MAAHPPIVVHRISPSGGRRVTVRDQIMGLAHSDRDLLEFLRLAGLPDADALLDDPTWIEWVGGREHEYEPLEIMP